MSMATQPQGLDKDDALRGGITLHGLLLIAASALPLTLAGLFAWTSWQATWQEARGEMRQDAVAVAEYAGRVLDGYRQAAGSAAALVRALPEDGILERRADIEQRLGQILATQPDLAAVDLIAADGRRLLAHPPSAEAVQPVPAGPAWPAGPGDLLLAPPPPQDGSPEGFVLALGVAEAGGITVALRVRAGELATRLSRMVTGPEDAAALLDAGGHLLARAAPARLPRPSTQPMVPDSPVLVALRAGLVRWSGRGPSPHDGVDRLTAFTRVDGFPAYAVVARPVARILAGWRQRVIVPVLLGLASGALLAALGLLVRRNQRAMHDANRLLEQRVAQRTAEVAAALAAQRAGDERLHLAIDAAGFASWEIDLRSGQVCRGGTPLMDMPDLPISGFTLEAYLEHVEPEDRARVLQALDALVTGSRRRHRVEYRVLRADGSWMQVESHGGVIERDAETGAPLRIAGVSRDITDRHQAEMLLRASEARLRVALDAARFSSWEYDVRADAGLRSGHLAIALPDPPSTGFKRADWMALVHPDDREAADQAFLDLIGGRTERMLTEFRVRRPDGTWASIESAGAVAERDPVTGAVLRIAGVARDVTAGRMAAQRQALLAREVDHRAKNALAVVQAALRLTPKTDAESYARAVEGRVRALARAHTLLADAHWEGASLHALAAAELAAFLPTVSGSAILAPGRARLEGPEVTLAPAAAQGVSMTLHELATNATKYGALSADGGQVALSWRVDSAAGMLRLRWQERGGPPVAAEPDRRGFGSRVVEATVRDQLGGVLTRVWEAEGLVCRIDLPLARAVGGSPAGRPAEETPPPRTLRAAE